MLRLLLISIVFCSGAILKAQEKAPLLNAYITEALQENLALQQENLELQSSLQALKQARGLFLPSLDIEARYSRANGGRTIDFPIGTIINPIYETLNALLGAPAFNQRLEDQQIALIREEEHDSRIRVTQPLFNRQIYNQYRIRQQQQLVQQAKTSAFARHLVAEVKTAYYQFITAAAIVQLMRETVVLLEENLRISKSLYNNNKVTRDAVFRAQAELSKAKQDLLEAQSNRQLSRSAFNFLLNRPLETAIETDNPENVGNQTFPNLEAATASALQSREEFRQLAAARAASGHAVGLEKSRFLPSLTLVADYGYQGESYNFGSEQDFWMASLVLRWNLFNGGQDHARVQKARIAALQLDNQRLILEDQIRLSVQQSHADLQVALAGVEAALEQLTAARGAYKIVDRKYREGLTSQIDYLDARNRLTASEVGKIAAENLLAQMMARFEQQSASLDIDAFLPNPVQP